VDTKKLKWAREVGTPRLFPATVLAEEGRVRPLIFNYFRQVRSLRIRHCPEAKSGAGSGSDSPLGGISGARHS